MPPRRLGFIDVGARGGVAELTAHFKDRLHTVLVEPEPVEAQRLQDQAAGNPHQSVIGVALAHIDGHIPFHETVNPTCSSVLDVNHAFLDRFTVSHHFQPRSRSIIACSRYDTLHRMGGLPIPHVMKIDVQGFEHQVLQGFGGLLSQCLAIQLETHFYPIYQGQSLMGDIVSYLANYDLCLRRITNSRNPSLNGDPLFEGELIEVDVVFTRTRPWYLRCSEEERADFILAGDLVGAPRY